MYLIKTPLLLKKLYHNSLVWNKSRTDKTIFLTFDDGPIPIVTPWVLKTLKNFNAKATFFCIGENITKNKEIFLQLKADGHAIGNHTYNHLRGWDTDNNVYIQNYKKCQDLTQTNLFRPPYGRIKHSQIKALSNEIFDVSNESQETRIEMQESSINHQDQLQKLKPPIYSKGQDESIKNQDHLQNLKPLTLNHKPSTLKIIMWDVLSGDFDTKLSPEKCLKNVLKHTQNGSIIVFHDSLKAWDRLKYALPKALEVWQKEGYAFKTL
jgi:peptidoglycan/xylan/chitin deacetylase (PgdA/CDA1 family)